MSLNLTVTTAGRAALVNASNTGTAPVAITQIGLSETAVEPNAAATTLPDEFKRIDGVAGDVVAADTIHVNVTDGSADTYALRAFALYLGDGTLFAIYGQAEPFLEKTAQSIAAISIDAVFADIDAALITFGDTNFLNPPATTERAGVVELTTSAEAIAGGDTVRAVTAKALKAAVAAWLDARFGAGNSGIWHPGNDGAGSGLDADLLDGQHGSFYANIPARLGYTPVQQGTGVGQQHNPIKIGWSGARLKATVNSTDHGSFVFDQHISDVWRSSNDGAGSGLDADTLDGFQGAAFPRLGFGNTFTKPQFFDLTDSQIVMHRAGENSPSAIFRTDPTDFYVLVSDPSSGPWSSFNELRPFRMSLSNGAITLGHGLNVKGWLTFDGNTVWHRGNDGAGSGLNADMLDGKHSDYFLRAADYSTANVMWRVRNADGAGSGLDADMLDGLHASSFVRTNSPGVVRAAAYATPTSGQIVSGFNVSSITYSASGGSGNGARAIVTYSNPVNDSVPVAMGGDSYNNSSSQSAFWGAGSSRGSTGFTACFGVSGGGGVPRVFSFITVGA